MAISAPSRHGKVVNFGGVFFGFSLHHLFMHMNLFAAIRLCTISERSKGFFLGFGSAQAPTEWVVGRWRGCGTCSSTSHVKIARGRGFESWSMVFTAQLLSKPLLHFSVISVSHLSISFFGKECRAEA